MSPPSQFVSSCMFLIFTICAFTHLELVASDIRVIRQVCAKTFFTDHCIDILMSNPRSSKANDYTQVGLATIDMTIFNVTKARDKANNIIALTRDPVDVGLLKGCTWDYDIIAEEMRKAVPLLQSKNEKEPWRPGYDSIVALLVCGTNLEHSQSDYRNELVEMNKGINNLLEIFMVSAHYYDRY